MPAVKKFVVLVSSSKKEEQLWTKILPTLPNHTLLKDKYSVRHWAGDTIIRRQYRSRLERFLRHDVNLCEALMQFLTSADFVGEAPEYDPEVTLVGAGGGCHIIQRFLLLRLERDEDARQIRRVRQAVFAAPLRRHGMRWVVLAAFVAVLMAGGLEIGLKIAKQGAPWVNGVAAIFTFVSSLLFTIFYLVTTKSQMDAIGFDSFNWWSSRQLQKGFDKLIVHGSKLKSGSWPVPTQSLTLGTISPEYPESVEAIAEAVASPKGHVNVYEVKCRKSKTVIRPLNAAGAQPVGVHASFDNVADKLEIIQFSMGNCTGASSENSPPPWEIKTATHGYLEVDRTHPSNQHENNLVKPDENFISDRKYIYRFQPRPGGRYSLHATVYGGYDAGDRDSHCHLRADAYFDRIEGVLDLSAYLGSGWRIVRPPEAYFFNGLIPKINDNRREVEGPACSCISSGRVLESGRLLQTNQTSPGVFTWGVDNLRDGGVMAYLFDVEKEGGK